MAHNAADAQAVEPRPYCAPACGSRPARARRDKPRRCGPDAWVADQAEAAERQRLARSSCKVRPCRRQRDRPRRRADRQGRNGCAASRHRQGGLAGSGKSPPAHQTCVCSSQGAIFRLARSNAAAKRARRHPLAALRTSRAFDALRSGAGLYHQTGQVVHQTAARAGRSIRGSSDCGGAASLARGRRARGKASGEIGWPRFFRASPRDWSPSLWPTSLHGSFQPLRRPARRFARRS